MKRITWNKDWLFTNGADSPLMADITGANTKEIMVQLPHDAMIHEERNKQVISGSQSGFCPGGTYTYQKQFEVPSSWEQQTIYFEFEGIYTNAKVFINGDYAGGSVNGYAGFSIKANMFLNYGTSNELKVTVNNSEQPNSRWYTGSGIYRDVHLLLADKAHIAMDGVHITTPQIDADCAMVVIDTQLENEHHTAKSLLLVTELYDEKQTLCGKEQVKVTLFDEATFVQQRIPITHPNLWDCDTPYLYECRIKLMEQDRILDEECISFGIREFKLDAIHGLRINGNPIKVRGSCIHHDNGVLGAATFYDAEKRRCELLKQAGFNCIRSAHHPMSKAMLSACDEIGMLVIDEVSDVWNKCKNHNDYATFFADHWQQDSKELVLKDRNHPCVLMYCLGNEIPEIGTPRGVSLNRSMHHMIKQLDPSRYTMNAMNGLNAAAGSIPYIFEDIQKQFAQTVPVEDSQKEPQETNTDGSNEMNNMMSALIGPLADMVATHPLMSEALEEASGSMDVLGFNYMTGRHELEHTLHPHRVVLGSETFPSEISRLWELVEKNPHVLGDVTWTGYDYLGEAGIGNFYYDGSQPFSNHWPDRIAYCGDIDITGYRRVMSYYREIIFGLRKEPYIAIQRMEHYGKDCLKTPWAWSDSIESWTWHGYEEKPVEIEVYSDADEVELFLNDRSLGKKVVGREHQCKTMFSTMYQPGTLKAVNYRDGKPAEMTELKSASEQVHLGVKSEQTKIEVGGEHLAFIEVYFEDETGIENKQVQKEVSVTLEGCGCELQGMGSADPQSITSFKHHTWPTWDGRLVIVLRSTQTIGTTILTIQAENDRKQVVIHTVEKEG